MITNLGYCKYKQVDKQTRQTEFNLELTRTIMDMYEKYDYFQQ